MRTCRLHLSLGLFVSLLALMVAPTALADARVDVEVKDAAGRLTTAQVTLTKGSVSKSCSTVGGRCSITVAAGQYAVRLQPSSGAATTSNVTVPASGSIRLALRVTATTTPPPTTTTPPPTTTSKPASTKQVQATQPGTTLRNVSRGTRMLVQGQVKDAQGRLTNATITLRQNGRDIGRATCVGGKFSMYDLARGTYTVVAVAANGATATVQLTVNTTLLKPTLRLPAR